MYGSILTGFQIPDFAYNNKDWKQELEVPAESSGEYFLDGYIGLDGYFEARFAKDVLTQQYEYYEYAELFKQRRLISLYLDWEQIENEYELSDFIKENILILKYNNMKWDEREVKGSRLNRSQFLSSVMIAYFYNQIRKSFPLTKKEVVDTFKTYNFREGDLDRPMSMAFYLSRNFNVDLSQNIIMTKEEYWLYWSKIFYDKSGLGKDCRKIIVPDYSERAQKTISRFRLGNVLFYSLFLCLRYDYIYYLLPAMCLQFLFDTREKRYCKTKIKVGGETEMDKELVLLRRRRLKKIKDKQTKQIEKVIKLGRELFYINLFLTFSFLFRLLYIFLKK